MKMISPPCSLQLAVAVVLRPILRRTRRKRRRRTMLLPCFIQLVEGRPLMRIHRPQVMTMLQLYFIQLAEEERPLIRIQRQQMTTMLQPYSLLDNKHPRTIMMLHKTTIPPPPHHHHHLMVLTTTVLEIQKTRDLHQMMMIHHREIMTTAMPVNHLEVIRAIAATARVEVLPVGVTMIPVAVVEARKKLKRTMTGVGVTKVIAAMTAVVVKTVAPEARGARETMTVEADLVTAVARAMIVAAMPVTMVAEAPVAVPRKALVRTVAVTRAMMAVTVIAQVEAKGVMTTVADQAEVTAGAKPVAMLNLLGEVTQVATRKLKSQAMTVKARRKKMPGMKLRGKRKRKMQKELLLPLQSQSL
mmetsp:Transcript_1985/g.4473  ORF Transcript_1985/g.4473 Transcript_1985/m.4473 type:complete len:358 (+) Transcript_1985:382-1455(+)